jgi:hypothetical protein
LAIKCGNALGVGSACHETGVRVECRNRRTHLHVVAENLVRASSDRVAGSGPREIDLGLRGKTSVLVHEIRRGGRHGRAILNDGTNERVCYAIFNYTIADTDTGVINTDIACLATPPSEDLKAINERTGACRGYPGRAADGSWIAIGPAIRGYELAMPAGAALYSPQSAACRPGG